MGGIPPKVSGGCRRAGTRAAARPMLPGPLAPLDPRKTRALTTIYAPRKLKARKHKTAQTRMLDNDIPIKPTLSPFHPLPAIGQKNEKPKTKVIVFDLNKGDGARLDTAPSIKLHDVLKPLTPLRIHGYARKSSLDLDKKPQTQQLLRENTYDVIEPIYVNAAKVRKRDTSITRRTLTPMAVESENTEKEEKQKEPKLSPKTRFKKAAIQVAKLSSMPETGKLLCLRERETFNVCRKEDKSSCKLEELPKSPAQKLNKLTEIFQGLEMNGRYKDKLKKENSWF